VSFLHDTAVEPTKYNEIRVEYETTRAEISMVSAAFINSLGREDFL